MPTQCALFLRIKLDVQSMFDSPKIKLTHVSQNGFPIPGM